MTKNIDPFNLDNLRPSRNNSGSISISNRTIFVVIIFVSFTSLCVFALYEFKVIGSGASQIATNESKKSAVINSQVEKSVANNDKNTEDSEKSAAENKALVEKIARLVVLPKDEDAIVGTVTNAEALKTQPFFKDAENGNKVIIFPKSLKAIIYDESKNLLINMGPVVLPSKKDSIEAPTPKGEVAGESTTKN